MIHTLCPRSYSRRKRRRANQPEKEEQGFFSETALDRRELLARLLYLLVAVIASHPDPIFCSGREKTRLQPD